jgi:hypothetical protein
MLALNSKVDTDKSQDLSILLWNMRLKLQSINRQRVMTHELQHISKWTHLYATSATAKG